ncbi:MAG: hypothetical protein JXB34_00840 [Bacteroidales bacterium]|nr:hypothetical protein [Bacteroidales bacterium]
MRKTICLGIIFLAISMVADCQQQLTAEKKIAYDKNGRIFINKELGAYLWISASPEDSSKKYRLVSDSSTKYVNPMYFDTEGYNTLRSPSCVDTVTKRMIHPEQDIIFEVYSDSRPPISRSRVIFSNHAIHKGKQVYTGDAKVYISATDEMSGVGQIYFSIDGKPYTAFSDTLKNFNEGGVALKYYSVDMVGNIEEIKEMLFYVDRTPPVTTADKSSGKSVKLNAADTLSGVKAVYYQLNNATVKAYTSPIKLKSSGNGTLTYWSVDNVNNTEAKKSLALD